jgi:uncharacterized protein (DUF2252 family)
MRCPSPSFLISPAVLAVVCVLAAPFGCEPDLDARTAFITSTIHDADVALIARDPDLVAQKYAKMASDPYEYVRGSISVYFADALSRRGLGRSTTAPPSSETPVVVSLIGDAHLENFGTFRAADGTVRLDLNDLDAACFGPFELDVWRLGMSFVVALHGAKGSEHDDLVAAEAVRSMATAYAETVRAVASGGAPPALHADAGHGRVIDALFAKVTKQGTARAELADYTVVSGEGAAARREMAYGDVQPPAGTYWEDTVTRLSAGAETLLRARLAEYAAQAGAPADELQLKGLSRRLGSGVGSYPMYRFYALIEGATASLDDDELLEFKEARDPPSLTGLELGPWPRFATNAERVVFFARTLQEGPDNDARLGWTGDRALSFKVRRRTAWQRSLSAADLRDGLTSGELSPDDLTVLGARLGQVLARAHTRGVTRMGAPAGAAIAAAVAQDADAFIASVVATSRAYGAQTVADAARFRDALGSLGPTLGPRRAP